MKEAYEFERLTKTDIKDLNSDIYRIVSNYAPRDTKKMKRDEGNSSRKNCIYVAKTDIDIKNNNKCLLNDQLRFNLHKLRDDFDTNPEDLIKPKNTG